MENSAKIECYSCIEGTPIKKEFEGVVCPEGWTIDENPCKNNNTNNYTIPQERKIKLNKTLYKHKDVMEVLNPNFSEFNTEIPTVPKFFNLYNTNFYDLRKNTHNYFIIKSEEYIGSIINSREKEIESLKENIERVQLEIDSIEREHPYFTNGSFLMHSEFNKAYNEGAEGISSDGQIQGPKYFMQSGKKRRITDDYSVYSKIKTRFGIQGVKDADLIVFLGTGGLGAIQTGPPINRLGDIFKSSYEVNMYTPNIP